MSSLFLSLADLSASRSDLGTPTSYIPTPATAGPESSIDFRRSTDEYSQALKLLKQGVLQELKRRHWHRKINRPTCFLTTSISFAEFSKNLDIVEANLDRWILENLIPGKKTAAILHPCFTSLSRPLLIRQVEEGKKEAYLLFNYPIDKKAEGSAKDTFFAYDMVGHKPRAVIISKPRPYVAGAASKGIPFKDLLFLQELENFQRCNEQPTLAYFNDPLEDTATFYVIEKRLDMEFRDFALTQNKNLLRTASFQNKANRKIILEKVLTKLASLHERDLVHRDIKAENILVKIDPDGTIRNAELIDWGFVCPSRSSTLIVGTAPYLAPEIAKAIIANNPDAMRLAITAKTDIWSFSYVLFFMFYDIMRQEDPEISDVLFRTYSYLSKQNNDIQTIKIIAQNAHIEFAELTRLKPKTAIGQLIVDMRKEDPKERPSAKEVLRRAIAYIDEMKIV